MRIHQFSLLSFHQSHFGGWFGQGLKFKISYIPLSRRSEYHQPLPAPLTANKSLSNKTHRRVGQLDPSGPYFYQPNHEGPEQHETPPRVANLRFIHKSPIKRHNHKVLLVVRNGSSPQRLLCLQIPTKASLFFLPLPLSYAPDRHTAHPYSFSPKAHFSFSKSDRRVFGRMGLQGKPAGCPLRASVLSRPSTRIQGKLTKLNYPHSYYPTVIPLCHFYFLRESMVILEGWRSVRSRGDKRTGSDWEGF